MLLFKINYYGIMSLDNAADVALSNYLEAKSFTLYTLCVFCCYCYSLDI